MTTKIPKRRRTLEAAAVLLLIVVVVPFVAVAVPQLVGADHSYVVQSSSMSPSIGAGDVVFVEEVPPRNVEQGDVITYRRPSASEATDDTDLVTHRVVEVLRQDDGLHFRTKGDANEEPDSELAAAENLVGVVRFAVPYLGRVVAVAGSTYGLVFLLIVPATLLVISEVWNLLGVIRDD